MFISDSNSIQAFLRILSSSNDSFYLSKTNKVKADFEIYYSYLLCNIIELTYFGGETFP